MIAEPLPTPQKLGWLDANQRVLAAELRRIAARLDASAESGEGALGLTEAEAALARERELIEEPAIDRIATLFGLSPFECDTLLLAAGVELEASIARRCVGLSGGPWASFGLALASLADPHWSALLPDAPLRAWQLVNLNPAESIVMSPLRIAEPVLHALAGLDVLDPALAQIVRQSPVAPIASTTQARISDELARRAAEEPVLHFQLVGDDADGQRDVAARAMRRLGRSLWLLPAADIPREAASRHVLATTWSRDAALTAASLLVTEAGEADIVADFVERISGIVGVAARHPIDLELEAARWTVDLPEPLEQRALWLEATDGEAMDEQSLDLLSSQFRLSAAALCATARRVVAARAVGDIRSVVAVARPQGPSDGLGELAVWLEPRAGWDQLVLPDEQADLLHEIVGQVRGRTLVHETWGFRSRNAEGLGIAALFEGDSGTGKSLAAEVIAGELGLAVLRVDLASVVSKYIGETEKNIARVFAAAEGSGAVILFDEAEALFGKRSEVRDSHDRYANIEVAYLLQRIEAYRGLAILTSNAKSSIDRAFLRRLRFVVRFPFPDQDHRERIWRTAFPSAAPLEGLDFSRLARLNLAGGDIRNIALGAAFLAAAAERPLSMAHIRAAARRELEKLGRSPAEVDTRGWE